MKTFVLIFLIWGPIQAQTNTISENINKRSELELTKTDLTPIPILQDDDTKVKESQLKITKIDDSKLERNKDELKLKDERKLVEKLKLKEQLKVKNELKLKDELELEDDLKLEKAADTQLVDRAKKACKTVASPNTSPTKICFEVTPGVHLLEVCKEDSPAFANYPLIQPNYGIPQLPVFYERPSQPSVSIPTTLFNQTETGQQNLPSVDFQNFPTGYPQNFPTDYLPNFPTDYHQYPPSYHPQCFPDYPTFPFYPPQTFPPGYPPFPFHPPQTIRPGYPPFPFYPPQTNQPDYPTSAIFHPQTIPQHPPIYPPKFFPSYPPYFSPSYPPQIFPSYPPQFLPTHPQLIRPIHPPQLVPSKPIFSINPTESVPFVTPQALPSDGPQNLPQPPQEPFFQVQPQQHLEYSQNDAANFPKNIFPNLPQISPNEYYPSFLRPAYNPKFEIVQPDGRGFLPGGNQGSVQPSAPVQPTAPPTAEENIQNIQQHPMPANAIHLDTRRLQPGPLSRILDRPSFQTSGRTGTMETLWGPLTIQGPRLSRKPEASQIQHENSFKSAYREHKNSI